MTAPEDLHEWLSFEAADEHRTWLFDLTFLTSNWDCIFGRGCPGVLTGPAADEEQGCCSYGAHFTGDADRTRVEARIAELGNERLSHVLSISSFLVNGKRAEVSDAVPADAQVDVLPPFAGG